MLAANRRDIKMKFLGKKNYDVDELRKYYEKFKKKK